MSRGGGYCGECGKAVTFWPEAESATEIPRAARDAFEAKPYCGWCGADLKRLGFLAQAIPDDVESRPTVAAGDAVEVRA